MNETPRKDLDNAQFMQLRQATEKIAGHLERRLKEHLNILKPLFTPRKLLGTYIRSSSTDEVLGSDKAFAEVQERYATVCEKPFGLSKKLTPPLAPISTQIDCLPYKYDLFLSENQEKPTSITSPTRWILYYRCECNLSRLRAMVQGLENRQKEDMKQSLINHITMVVFLNHFPALGNLLKDLRYNLEVCELEDLGGMPAVMLKAPIKAFLPPDEFILQITQLSGIPAFQEIIDPEEVSNIPDPLKESIEHSIDG